MSDTPATPEQIELIKNSGASSLADLAKQGGDFTLTPKRSGTIGAGFVSDMLARCSRRQEPPGLRREPHVGGDENVANQNPAAREGLERMTSPFSRREYAGRRLRRALA